jgi:hypothetical protein
MLANPSISQDIPSVSLSVALASHIAKEYRIHLLFATITSLIEQTMPVPIYVSVSFASLEMRDTFIELFRKNDSIRRYPLLYVYVRPEKTSQMRHYSMLCDTIGARGDVRWVLFCDDDDIYDKDRVKVFSENIQSGGMEPGKKLAGAYESTFNKHHREHRHEYWCYCLNIDILTRFFEVVGRWADVLDHQCCDILLAEHLRRLHDDWSFIRITEHLYHYKTEDNGDSVTGCIQQRRSTWQPSPPDQVDPIFPDYMVALNDFLHQNLSLYEHDTYLRTIVGNSFDNILRYEFKADYPFLKFVDEVHVDKLKQYHEYLRAICDELYDNKLP